jgi:hypothetical protein
MIGHVGGVPIEELLLPFLASSATMLAVAAKVAFGTATRRERQSTQERSSQ